MADELVLGIDSAIISTWKQTINNSHQSYSDISRCVSGLLCAWSRKAVGRGQTRLILRIW
jgi:hypothetical protein